MSAIGGQRSLNQPAQDLAAPSVAVENEICTTPAEDLVERTQLLPEVAAGAGAEAALGCNSAMPKITQESVSCVVQVPGEKNVAKRNALTNATSWTGRVVAEQNTCDATAEGSAGDVWDDVSCRTCEIGYRSAPRPEESPVVLWRSRPKDKEAKAATKGGPLSTSNELPAHAETCPRGESCGLQQRRSIYVKRDEAARDSASLREDRRGRREVCHDHMVETGEKGTWRRDYPYLKPPENTQGMEWATGHGGSPDLSETMLGHKYVVRQEIGYDDELAQTPTEQYAAPCDENKDVKDRIFCGHSNHLDTWNDGERHTTDKPASTGEGGDDAFEAPPGGGFICGQRKAWPPSLSSSSCSPGTLSFSPQPHQITPQGSRARVASSMKVPAATMAKGESQISYPEEYRSAGFVARQQHEQLAADYRREECLRAQDESRRNLVSDGRWMNRSSRAILAQSSCSYGGSGGGKGFGPSVFERLTHRTSYHDTRDPFGCGESNNEESGTPAVGADGDGAYGYRFQPTINPRSSLLASRMPQRDKDVYGCPQQRLYREGEEKLWRREMRIQLADEALREMAVARHMNPGSERVLARRSRSRMIRFRAKMMELLEVVDAGRSGWLSLAGLERVLSECGMLPDQSPLEFCDDVLLAVWTALSEERISDLGGRGGSGSGDGGSDQGDGGKTFGVPVNDLAVLLAAAASWSHDHGGFDAPPQRNGRKSLPLHPVKHQVWRGGQERGQERGPVPHVFATELQDQRIRDLCKELSGVFEVNRLYDARRRQEDRIIKTEGMAAGKGQACSQVPRTGLRTSSGRKVGEDVSPPPRVATPGQVAATAARFEEQICMRERKIERLRTEEQARKMEDHPFVPSMAATATPEAAALRRQVALAAGRKGTSVPSRDRVTAESQQATLTDLRTTEEREVEENCTFQPRLFQPLPIPPPRYPAPNTAFVEKCGGNQNNADYAGAPNTTTAAATVDRATASWKAQVDRLKAGRKNRLLRLEEEQAAANRSEPLPPAVQQLFVDAGMQMRPQESNSGRSGATANKQGSGRTTKRESGNKPRASAGKVHSPTSRLRLQGRSRGGCRLKEKRREEEACKSAEDAARQQKLKRALARACKRSAAVAGLEAALSAREVERGRTGLDDPPVVIVEVEFVRQNLWVLVPLWADTCPRKAVGKLAKQQQRVVAGAVAHDLETYFRHELALACKRPTGPAECREFGGAKAGPTSKNRLAVPQVVLRVDTV